MQETKTMCECGGSYNLNSRAEHFRSAKHQYFIENGKPNEKQGKKVYSTLKREGRQRITKKFLKDLEENGGDY